MDRLQYAVAVVTSHMEKAGIAWRTGGFVAIEIGPGDSLFSGLVAHALGASHTHLVSV